MATFVLTAAATVFSGSALGGATAATIAGATITWGGIATVAATAAGAYLDAMLFAPKQPDQSGPRLSDLDVGGGAEGSSIPRVYGTVRVPGLLIWSTRLRELATSESVGGKGGGGTVTNYQYFASFAVALGEGEIDSIGKVWADNQILDLDAYNWRLYTGAEDQMPDPLIETVEGVAPAYRGLAYLVFEDVPLADFGNRVPVLGVEVTRRFEGDEAAGLQALMDRINSDFGIDADVSGVEDRPITGYLIDRPMSAKAAIAPLLAAFRIDVAEIGGQIKVWTRRDEASAVIDAGQLVLDRSEAPIKWVRSSARELPRSAVLAYRDQEREYQAGAITVRRALGLGEGEQRVDLPIITTEAEARELAEAALADAWAGQVSASMTLPPSAIATAPGDVVQIVEDGRIYDVRCTRVGWEFSLPIEAQVIAERPSVPRKAAARRGIDGTVAPLGALDVVVIDCPMISDDHEHAHAPRIALDAAVWTGGAIYGSVSGSGFAYAGLIERRSAIGVLTAHLSRGVTGVWDRGSELVVEMQRGQLSSLPEIDVLAGRNRLAVQGPNGGWEILAFCSAELIASKTYRLTKLLRGLRGSEAHRGAGPGRRVVRLDGAVVPFPVPSDRARLANIWRVGPAARPYDDALFEQFEATFKSIGLRPYAPGHLSARRLESGDLALGWVRRTRIGGDDWVDEVPLSEAVERYRVAVRVDGKVARILESDRQGVTYLEADAVADHGGAMPAAIDFSVAQYSELFGWGAARRESVRIASGGIYADSYERVLDPLAVPVVTSWLRGAGVVNIYFEPLEGVTVRAEAGGQAAAVYGAAGGIRIEGLERSTAFDAVLWAEDGVQVSDPVTVAVYTI